jgi:gamma-glutamyltranspeptidase
MLLTVPVAVVVPLLAVVLFGRWSGHEEAPAWRVPPMGGAQQLWKWTLLSALAYPTLFFLAGYYIAFANEEVRAFYGGIYRDSFLEQVRAVLRDTPQLLPFETLRGALWVAMAVAVLWTTRGRTWVGGLWVVLLFTLVQNDVHLLPNPLMPPTVQAFHFVETVSSNAVFALLIIGLMSRAHFGGKAGHHGPIAPRLSHGKGVMVPGALHGLESIHGRFGKLPWSRLVEPATTLAREGFPVDAVYAATIDYRAEALRSTLYGEKTFFQNGKPLQAGDKLLQPELAKFLEEVAQRGSAAMYRGAWGERCIETVRSRGGRMELQDLHNYRSRWLSPRRIRYRDCDVYGASGRSYGGAWSLLALKTLEHFDMPSGPHFSESTDRLEVMVRVAQTVWNEAWLYETENLDDDATVESYLAAPHAASVWERVRQELPADLPDRRGNHSYHSVVVDDEGNAITGTNTINSLPWGESVFVDGVPLTNTLSHVGTKTRPGERRLTPMSSHLVFQDGRLRIVSGTFNSSLLEGGFQLLVSTIDFNLTAKQAATLPRFGTFSFDDDKPDSSSGKMWLDLAVSKEIVDELRKRGLEFEQDSPFVDTGSGAIVILADDGEVDAALLPLAGHELDEPVLVDATRP